jgi:hypothetical protein
MFLEPSGSQILLELVELCTRVRAAKSSLGHPNPKRNKNRTIEKIFQHAYAYLHQKAFEQIF